MFELALDAVSLLVDVLIVGVLDAAIAFGRDDGRGSGLQNAVVEAVGVIGAVSQDVAGAEALDQIGGALDVVFLTWSSDQAQAIAQTVGGGVDLGAQSATRAAKALGMSPPFCQRAPAACW